MEMPSDLKQVYIDQNAKLEKILADYKEEEYIYKGTDPIKDAQTLYKETKRKS